MPQQCKTARRRTRRLIKLPCVLSLRRHYPVPVQTVGDAFGRPLSLVCPSSRQNCVSVSTSIVPLNLTPPTRQVNRPPNVGILNKNRHWVLRGSMPAARPANTPALPRSWCTPSFALPAGSACSAAGRVRQPPFLTYRLTAGGVTPTIRATALREMPSPSSAKAYSRSAAPGRVRRRRVCNSVRSRRSHRLGGFWRRRFVASLDPQAGQRISWL